MSVLTIESPFTFVTANQAATAPNEDNTKVCKQTLKYDDTLTMSSQPTRGSTEVIDPDSNQNKRNRKRCNSLPPTSVKSPKIRKIVKKTYSKRPYR